MMSAKADKLLVHGKEIRSMVQNAQDKASDLGLPNMARSHLRDASHSLTKALGHVEAALGSELLR